MGRSVCRTLSILAALGCWIGCLAGSDVKITSTKPRAARFESLPSSLTCVSPQNQAIQENPLASSGAKSTGITTLHDPRSKLIGQDILICELPWNHADAIDPSGTHRVYAVLGTVKVPHEDGSHNAPFVQQDIPLLPQDTDRPHSDTLLSFSEWKEQHLEQERQERARIKQRDKSKSHARAEKSSDPAAASVGEAHLLTRVAEQLGMATEAAQSAAAAATLMSNWSEPNVSVEDHADQSTDSAFASTISSSAEATATKPASHSTTTTNSVASPSASSQSANAAWSGAKAPADYVKALENTSEILAKLKHRWNYASLDCAAVLHQSNPSAKFPTAILSEKKDRYMLSPCPVPGRESQFVIVELCQQVRIDTLVLANLEFFSSMFKTFTARVSNDLQAPESDWRDLGVFRAKNVRGPQVFVMKSVSHTYYRFLRIDFLEHYGSEYYCPVSLLRVYGRNEREDADEADDLDPDNEAEIEDDVQESDRDSEEDDVDLDTSCDIHVAKIRNRIQICPAHTMSIWPCICLPRVPVYFDNSTASRPGTSLNHSDPSSSSSRASAASPIGNTRDKNATQSFNAASSNSTSRSHSKPADAKPSEKGPQGGESIFKTITKRLAALEANTSLSMQYLQLSSQVLRDKLMDLDRTQNSRMTQLFNAWNATYTQQLDTQSSQFRQALEQRDIALHQLHTQIQRLATDLGYEKRRGFVQLILLFILLVLLVVTRSPTTAQSLASWSNARTNDDSKSSEIHTPRARYASPFQRVLSPLTRSPLASVMNHSMTSTSEANDEHGPKSARNHSRTSHGKNPSDAVLWPRPVSSVKYPHTRRVSLTPSPSRHRWNTTGKLRRRSTTMSESFGSQEPGFSSSLQAMNGSEWIDGEEDSVHTS
ncbi:hypothetical protein MYAM1_002972 [Malassezia yamatoensis]|uniref:SUN domain-containing protein n=1 Tax=Malassezia yamatoensis TaxID=253288 RepID=A0AAJ5YVV1_9BASI|nr:hypothetical protein MYAM1_002972 [Malassezia yamatoensis]